MNTTTTELISVRVVTPTVTAPCDSAPYQQERNEIRGSDVDSQPAMTWDRFWQLIDLVGGPAATASCDHADEAYARLTDALALEPADRIIAFGERLAEALYRLDRRDIADRRPCCSDDGFLYARAAVVTAGRLAYESVLADPDRFADFEDEHGEQLLHVPEEAYEQATGEEWDHVTRYDYESCSNSDGWATGTGTDNPVAAHSI